VVVTDGIKRFTQVNQHGRRSLTLCLAQSSSHPLLVYTFRSVAGMRKPSTDPVKEDLMVTNTFLIWNVGWPVKSQSVLIIIVGSITEELKAA